MQQAPTARIRNRPVGAGQCVGVNVAVVEMATTRSAAGRRPEELTGRRSECEVLDRLLDAVRAGESRAPSPRSIARLGRTRARVELARGQLVYREWLRRENRRVDAREQLRTAHEMFASMGAEAFPERARRGLLASGETVRKDTPPATRPARRRSRVRSVCFGHD